MRLYCVVIPVLLLAPLPSQADPLVQARRLVVQGRHAAARTAARVVLRRRPNDPEALQIEVAASCALGDAAAARVALARLAQDVQAMALRYCFRRGIDLTRERDPALEQVPVPISVPVSGSVSGPESCPPVELTGVELVGPSPPGGQLEQAPPADPRRSWRIAFWAGVGATAVSVIAVVGLALHINELEQEKERLILDWRMNTGYPAFGAGADICPEAARVGAGALSDLCQRGQRAATASNVLLGVGLVTAALSGYLYYRGYIKKELVVGPTRLALTF